MFSHLSLTLSNNTFSDAACSRNQWFSEVPTCCHCRENTVSCFPSLSLSLCVLSSLCSSSLLSRLPPSEYLQSVERHFFIRLMKKKGKHRRIKRGGEMKREWDTVPRQWHWQRALRNVQGGIGIGAGAEEHWFESCFCAYLSPLFFCQRECESVWWFFICREPCHTVLPSLLSHCLFRPKSAAPHEICKEEHLLSMSWKRASAGETVYNKCPTNATGQ